MGAFLMTNVERIRAHVETKKEFTAFAKQLFRTIGETVAVKLKGEYPGVGYQFLVARSPEVIAKFEAEYGEAPDIGWVAMSFHGHDLYHVHIGTLVDFGRWPITYSIGFHLLDQKWQKVKDELARLDWEQYLGSVPQYEYCKPNDEHMYNDPGKKLDLHRLEDQIEVITSRIAQYYKTAAPIVLSINHP